MAKQGNNQNNILTYFFHCLHEFSLVPTSLVQNSGPASIHLSGTRPALAPCSGVNFAFKPLMALPVRRAESKGIWTCKGGLGQAGVNRSSPEAALPPTGSPELFWRARQASCDNGSEPRNCRELPPKPLVLTMAGFCFSSPQKRQNQTKLSESNPFTPSSRPGPVEEAGRCGKLRCGRVSPASPRLPLVKPHVPESGGLSAGFHHLLFWVFFFFLLS